jgi:hypothetical protein
VESALSRGIAWLTALFAGCVLAVTLALPAWAGVAQPQTTSTKHTASQQHKATQSTPKIVRAQIHPMPKVSPDASSAGFTEICGGDFGIILFDGSYACMNQGFATYNTGSAVVEAAVSFVPGRIWIHQTTGNGGGSYCLTPDPSEQSTYSFINLHQALANVQISDNATDCGQVSVAFACNDENGYGPEYAATNQGNWNYTHCFNQVPETYDTSGQGTVAGLANFTGGRVWFHGTNSSGVAYSDCASNDGFYAVGGEDTDPSNVQTTTNASAC